MMNLYLLKLTIPPTGAGLEIADSFVIRAKNKKMARGLASAMCGDEGWASWTDSYFSSCKKLKDTGKQAVILRSFNAL